MIYAIKPPVVELQAIRGLLHAQLEHIRRAEANGADMDFQRGYCESKIAALDAGIAALDPGLIAVLQETQRPAPMFLAKANDVSTIVSTSPL